MNGFGRAVLCGAGALLVALSVGNACASEFTDRVERVFSPTIIESAEESGSTGKVVLKVPDRHPEYFETGDKANKIFAIETVRIFRDVPNLQRLIVTVPREQGSQSIDVTRSQVEQYYAIKLADMEGNLDVWRKSFSGRYDNKKSRASFVEEFVTEK